VKAEDAVHSLSQSFVMRRDQGRGPLPAHQPQELIEHAIGGCLIEIAGGLIGQHQSRSVGERARHGDALLLAA